MKPLTTNDILWAKMLANEPIQKERKRSYLWEGFLHYIAMFILYPRKCLSEVFGCLLIFGAMFFMLYLSEIAQWIERWAK